MITSAKHAHDNNQSKVKDFDSFDPWTCPICCNLTCFPPARGGLWGFMPVAPPRPPPPSPISGSQCDPQDANCMPGYMMLYVRWNATGGITRSKIFFEAWVVQWLTPSDICGSRVTCSDQAGSLVPTLDALEYRKQHMIGFLEGAFTIRWNIGNSIWLELTLGPLR